VGSGYWVRGRQKWHNFPGNGCKQFTLEMRDVVSSLRFVASDVVSPANEFPVVTLYHGTYLANLDSIRSNGIVSRAIDAKTTVEVAVNEVVDGFNLTPEQARELKSSVVRFAVERITESGFSKVYLSGERSYAEGNAKAGGEWYEEIIRTATAIKHEDFYELQAEYARRTSELERKMKEHDAMVSSLGPDMEIDQYHKELSISRELDRQHGELQKERREALDDRRREMDREGQEILRKRFGDEAVVFTVEMPYAVFVGKIASSRSRERIVLFEEMYAQYVAGGRGNWFSFIHGDKGKVWEFFQEVHLSGVEPRFIRGWDILN